jgi:hypothetical protein
MDIKGTAERDTSCSVQTETLCSLFSERVFQLFADKNVQAYLASSNLGKLQERLHYVIEFRSLCITTAVSLWTTYIKIMIQKYDFIQRDLSFSFRLPST